MMADQKSAEKQGLLHRLLIWILTGAGCGIAAGSACVFFAWLTSLCDKSFHDHERMLYLLPAAGLLVVTLYHWREREGELSLNGLFRAARGEEEASLWLVPLIALSTCLAYLFGGSVGRVGSALQIGGGLTLWLGSRINGLGSLSNRQGGRREDPDGRRPGPGGLDPQMLFACGIACGFTGILNAPLAGAVFGAEVLILKGKEWICLLPTAISSFITWGISHLAGVSYVDFHHVLTGGLTEAGSTSDIEAAASLVHTGLTGQVLLKVAIISLAAMLAGRIFCLARRLTTRAFDYISNPWIRVLVGTAFVIGLTLLIGNTDQNGIGFVYVDHVLDGRSAMLAFLWKLALTTLTLGCGIRGGEIAPTIFIGATAAFAAGCLIGLDPALAAAVGIVGTLASVTNCPVASWIYGMEAISAGPEMALYFGIAVIAAHFLSGTGGLYAEQPAETQWLKPARSQWLKPAGRRPKGPKGPKEKKIR